MFWKDTKKESRHSTVFYKQLQYTLSIKVWEQAYFFVNDVPLVPFSSPLLFEIPPNSAHCFV